MNLPAARALLKGADVVLAVGTELAESDIWGPPLELDGALIRLDLDPAQAHGNNAAAIALIGDAAAGLAGLLAELGAGAPAAGEAIAAARARLDAEHGAQAAPVDRVDRRAAAARSTTTRRSSATTRCAATTARSAGSPCGARARSCSRPGSARSAASLPAAIGVALARPQHRTVAICGDGGLMFIAPRAGVGRGARARAARGRVRQRGLRRDPQGDGRGRVRPARGRHRAAGPRRRAARALGCARRRMPPSPRRSAPSWRRRSSARSRP